MPKRRLADNRFKELTKVVDPKEIAASIQKVFGDFPDPRRSERCMYPAWVLILIAVCGMIAGCDTIADIAEWAEAAETPLLRPLLGEKFRSPCYDTLWWFLVRVSPSAFNNLLRSWWERLPPELQTPDRNGNLLIPIYRTIRARTRQNMAAVSGGLFAFPTMLNGWKILDSSSGPFDPSSR